jgi:hypothetical protein
MPAPSLLDYQVQALARLDEMNALIQNEVQVNHSAHGPLVVEGVLPTEERKKELQTALNRMSQKGAVSLALNTAAEFEAQQMKSRTAPLQVQSLDVPISEMQTNEDVRKYLGNKTGLTGDSLQREMQEFSDAMLDHVAEAQKHALMLRKLAQVFTTSEVDSMSAPSRQQWKALVAKHALAVEREIGQVRSELAPAFGASLSTQGGPSFVDLQSAATLLTELTAKSETMLWKGLASPSKANSATCLRNPAFWSTLQNAQELAGSIARQFQ